MWDWIINVLTGICTQDTICGVAKSSVIIADACTDLLPILSKLLGCGG